MVLGREGIEGPSRGHVPGTWPLVPCGDVGQRGSRTAATRLLRSTIKPTISRQSKPSHARKRRLIHDALEHDWGPYAVGMFFAEQPQLMNSAASGAMAPVGRICLGG